MTGETHIKLSDTTKRVLKVFEYLKKTGMVATKRDFCMCINYNEFSFGRVISGDRSLPDSYLHVITERFNVNPDYLFEGKKPMFLNNTPPVKNVNELRKALNVKKIKRIWTKDASVTESENGFIVTYVTHDDKKHVIEFIQK